MLANGASPRHVFVTGGTGYIGSRVIPALADRGHRVTALIRQSSAPRLPRGCTPVMGDALDAETFAAAVVGCDTFVQLVGTPHPRPSKAAEFERVDLGSVRASITAVSATPSVSHFVYLSVAPSASVMRAYVDVRMRGEALVRAWRDRAPGTNATFLRPWYVLGPGHRWPYALVPLYWIMERIPSTRARARELGLVTLDEMVSAIVCSIETPAVRERVISVPEIRQATRRESTSSR
jgi:nucleoside-diphosphate-sugar epimerase